MSNLTRNEMERKYHFGALAYMKLLQLQDKVNELDSVLMMSGSYSESYQTYIDSLTDTIGKMLEHLEFKYK